MRFETEWPGDTVAAPVYGTYNWEEGSLDSLGGSWSRFDTRRDGVDPVPTAFARALREREIGRIRAAWRTIDDRTLEDIGISRIEFQYAQDPRP